MKKRNYIYILLILVLFKGIKVKALNASISSNNYVNIDNNIVVRATLSHNAPIGSWKAQIIPDPAFLRHVGGNDLTLVGYGTDNKTYSKTYTYTFRTKKLGKTCFTFRVSEFFNFTDEKGPFTAQTTKCINITAPKEYSSNNYLKSLSIDNINFNFNKNTLNYDIALEKNTEKIKINAETEDAKARVDGIGEIKLKNGMNNIKINVNAENGSTRTYSLNINNPNKKGIKIDFNKEKYDLVREEEDLNKALFEKAKLSKTTYKGEEIDVMNFNNHNILITKDRDNKLVYFLLINDKEYLIIDKTALTEKTSNENEYYAYYNALDLKTNKKELYRYSKKDKTIQREYIIKKKDNKNIIIIILSSLLLIMFIIILVSLIKKNKGNKNEIKETHI